MGQAPFCELQIARRGPAFDQRSIAVYVMLCAMLCAVCFGVLLTEFTVGSGGLFNTFIAAVAVLPTAMIARVYGMGMAALAIEAATLPLVFGSLTVALTVMLCAVSGPFADDGLFAADRLLGLDWLALYQFYQRHPFVMEASKLVYGTFIIQATAIPLLLVALRRNFWTFLTAWGLATIAAALIFPFFPAAGPYVLHNLTPDAMPGFDRIYPWQTGPAIEAIRNGQMRNIVDAARGFISLPSFHAAGAVMFIWATFRLPWIGWPLAVWNVALICSAAITGAHYFVDLFAGIALGILAIGCAQWLVGRNQECAAKAHATPMDQMA